MCVRVRVRYYTYTYIPIHIYEDIIKKIYMYVCVRM